MSLVLKGKQLQYDSCRVNIYICTMLICNYNIIHALVYIMYIYNSLRMSSEGHDRWKFGSLKPLVDNLLTFRGSSRDVHFTCLPLTRKRIPAHRDNHTPLLITHPHTTPVDVITLTFLSGIWRLRAIKRPRNDTPSLPPTGHIWPSPTLILYTSADWFNQTSGGELKGQAALLIPQLRN